MFAPLVSALSESRRVILVDLQGHGRTADIDRPLRPELMADDVAALIKHLGVEQADLLVFGDADAIRPAHMVEFFALLGGGLKDAGFDGSGCSSGQLPSCRAPATTTSWPTPTWRPS
jgi:hypothetical protein